MRLRFGQFLHEKPQREKPATLPTDKFLCLKVPMNQLNTDHFKEQNHFSLGSLESVTSSFIEKTDVPASFWKTHTSEERSDISSELDCSGLAYLEQWHYSVFQSNGTCSLGRISNESETVTDGSNQKITINIDAMGDSISVFTVQSYYYRYSPFIYEIFENTDDTEHCNIHCYFDDSQKCDFYFVYNDKCYFGNFDTDQNDHNYAYGTQQMYIMKGEHTISFNFLFHYV